jgi:hypothetical protein
MNGKHEKSKPAGRSAVNRRWSEAIQPARKTEPGRGGGVGISRAPHVRQKPDGSRPLAIPEERTSRMSHLYRFQVVAIRYGLFAIGMEYRGVETGERRRTACCRAAACPIEAL